MKKFRWVLVITAILGLIGVRIWENQLFYDPFLTYFHEADQNAFFPEVVWNKLMISHIFRFLLNVFFSAAVIHCIFLNKKWTFQAVLLMGVVFAVTFPVYLYSIYTKLDLGYLFTFYVRRFVIQPLILLLIIPLFYYRKSLQENQSS